LLKKNTEKLFEFKSLFNLSEASLLIVSQNLKIFAKSMVLTINWNNLFCCQRSQGFVSASDVELFKD